MRGAACCGSNSAFPSIISGDDKTQISTTLTAGRISALAQPSGKITALSDAKTPETFASQLDAATLLSDRWQIGTSLPLRYRAVGDTGAWSVGDITLNVAYEALPEWAFSAWVPKGFVFVQARVPTGTSRFESSQLNAIDVSGKGFWGVSAGVLLLKTWGSWDVSLLGQIGQSFAHSYGDSRYVPGANLSAGLGLGVSPGAGSFRIGAFVGPIYEAPISVEGPLSFDTPSEMGWQSTLQLSYMASSTLSLSLAYADQRLFQSVSHNVPIGQSLSFVLQKRWSR